MKEGEVISDKAEKDWAQNEIKNNQDKKYVSQETTVGVAIDECPILPLGNQIFLEFNLKDKTDGGIITEKPIPKYKYPKVIGYGKLVKSVNIGDHIAFKNTATQIENYVVDGFKFHIVYETSLMGIYRGNAPEEKVDLSTIEVVKPTIIT